MERSHPGTWCVLVLGEGDSPPVDLLDAMRRRGLGATIARGVHRGLAWALVSARERERGVLLLVRPREIGGARELVDLLGAYLPMVRCWRFDPDAAGLVPMEAGDLPASENAGRWHDRSRGSWEFCPGLTGAPPRADSADAGPWMGSVPMERVELTDEELSLLRRDESSAARGDAASDAG